MEQKNEIVKTVVGWLFSDIAISHPLYCPQVKSEKDGEKLTDKLPLVYIWNENKTVGSFSLSINGSIVGETLENLLPRSDPSFVVIRDQIMETVRKLAIDSVISTCEKVGALPSVVFSKEVYLEICKST